MKAVLIVCVVLVALLHQVEPAAAPDSSLLAPSKDVVLAMDDSWDCMVRSMVELYARTKPKVEACFDLATTSGGNNPLVFLMCMWEQRLEIAGDYAEILFQECF